MGSDAGDCLKLEMGVAALEDPLAPFPFVVNCHCMYELAKSSGVVSGSCSQALLASRLDTSQLLCAL